MNFAVLKKAMKNYNYSYFVLVLSLCLNFSFAQKITVDNSLSPQQLIENHLVEGCVEVTNITSPINGSINGFGSFGYFEQDISNFPFANGIMLTTGNANSGGNTTNDNILNDGELTWGTDPDLETALGITDTHNATTIEFDFVSISNLIQFNYILASEEYFGNFPCEYSDGFAFLIRQAGTGDPYTNIALIPGTSIPVNTSTIHDEIVGFCDAENDQFFDGYSLGDTNYNGRTTVLTASASITPNVQYHIKLVIADQSDENYDSAVFIQGNSFNPTVDLGPDVTTCAEEYTINGDIQNPLATYSWFLNGSLLSGETNPALNITSSGTYVVQISIPLNGEDCVIQDTIEVTLNSEQTAEPLSDYELCDDITGDGIETFDLSIMDAEALASVPASNYIITYHLTNADAQNGINAITNPIQNTSNPQTIFVRIEDIDSGCLAFTSFNLIVNALPEIVSPNNVEYCDDSSADGSTAIDLTALDADITLGNPNLVVTYHFSQIDADTGANPIPSPYVNTNPNETIFIRVVDTTTGCQSTTSFTIEVLDRPETNSGIDLVINGCVEEGNGFGEFDLTEIIPDLLDGLTGVTVTFHETQEDANNGVNAIADATNYTNVIENVQTIYIRIEDDITGCFTIVPLALHANLLITGVNIIEFANCDDDSGDGIEEFDLLDIANTIGNDITDVVITFYETEDDLINQINPIDQTVPYVVSSSPVTLYVHIAIPDCERNAEINLIINPPVITDPIDPLDYCDTNDNGFINIFLRTFDDTITANNDTLSVEYFLTEQDAIDNTNALGDYFTNVSNPQPFFVRIIDVNTGCSDIQPFEVNVLPAPTTSTPNNIIVCDDDQDGFAVVDLTQTISELVTDVTDRDFTYYLTEIDASNASNVIPNPTTYNTDTRTIYARTENTITGCYSTEVFEVIVNTGPDFPTISPFQQCETDNNQTADFLFVDKDAEILNGQTGKEVLYFETQLDATNRTNIIDKNIIYTNITSPQTIFVRVENLTDQDCFGTSSFEIEVGSIPIFNPPTNFIVCDDISNDGIHEFDLSEKIDEISQGSPETLTITFHTTFDAAENGVNEIPLIFSNIDNPQQIYARIENGTYCHGIAEFGLNVVQVPLANLPNSLETCDDDYDGISTFDLTVAEFEILDVRDDDIIITYFETEADLEADTNEILTPENYTNIENPQTVYVKVLNVISQCYVSIPLELIVHLPPVINAISTIDICDNDEDEFLLSEATDILINNTTNTTVSYYLSQTDAENEVNPLNESYTYNGASTTIFIRAQTNNTVCFRIQSFDLIVNPNPLVNTPANLEACDDDYDFEFIFDLSQQDSSILSGLNGNDYTLTYHEIDIEAENGTNAIQDLNYNAYDGQEIFVRLENNITGCYGTTSFLTIVHRKPVVEIEDQIICLDNLPLTVSAGEIVVGDTYLWSNGETTPEIEINNIGTYSVTVTTPEGCQTTSNSFNVIESEQATIEITETVDFSDPNNITVTISGIGNYIYILDDGEPQESNVFENVGMGYHTVTVIDLNGCASATIEVLVIDYPKFMTPNNDGAFDSWHIVGVETLPGTTITIFDRYGKQLAFLTSTSQGWNGKYNGHDMPANDYWFVANVVQGDNAFQIKSHFAIRR